jgi:hypothetical protein
MTPNRFPATAAFRVIRRHKVMTAGLVLFTGIVSAAWWSRRSVSLELAAVYAEGFRKVGLPEQ